MLFLFGPVALRKTVTAHYASVLIISIMLLRASYNRTNSALIFGKSVSLYFLYHSSEYLLNQSSTS